MYIKEVVLEGFKSYAVRTVISGWDPQFNAITGLNGSGKSNILDAICFVLGITSLQHVRATNLQDLVYKRGQAGIQKASVSIIFDNSNKEASPVGYADFSEIVVTRRVGDGKNKYLINGHTTQQHVIQNLFQSVQLNVNNPHFLIMQGKITKVLNMKPLEILAMMEEAAGTRMFEERKEKALKTILKKEKRLEEIQALLQEELIPKLDKLRKEKAAYIEYQSTLQAKEKIERQVLLLEYGKEKNLAQESSMLLTRYEEELMQMETEIRSRNEKLSEIESRESEILKAKKDETIIQLESQAAALSRDLSKWETRFSLKTKAVEEEKQHFSTLQRSIQQLKESAKHQEEKTQDLARSLVTLESLKVDRQREVEQTQEMLVSLSLNQSSSGFEEQIKEQNALLEQFKIENDTIKTKFNALVSEKKKLIPELEKNASNNRKIMKEIEAARLEVTEKERVVEKTLKDLEAHTMDQIQSELKFATLELHKYQEEYDKLSAQVSYAIRFDYDDPTPNFDRSAVKGPVASLITVDKKNFEKTSAIEMTAGGKLYNVIVENEKVGSQLLKQGRLKKRVTLIPLNKIQPFILHKEKIDLARSVSSGNAELAVDLVQYDRNLKPAMDFVFGSTFVCKDAATANNVTFHQGIKARSVTWAGDVYDPSGVLSGGSKPQSSGLLLKLSRFRSLQSEISAVSEHIQKLQKDQLHYQNLSHQYDQLLSELEMAKKKSVLIQQRLKENEDTSLAARLQLIEDQIKNLEHQLADVEQRRQRAQTNLDTLKSEQKSFSSDKSQQTQTLKKKLEALKAKFNQCTTEHRNVKIQVDTQKLELEQSKKNLENSILELKTTQTQLEAAVREMEHDKREMEECKETHTEIQGRLKAEKQIRSALDQDLQKFKAQKVKLTSELQEWELEKQNIQTNLEKLVTQSKHAKAKVQELENTNPFLLQTEQEFTSQELASTNLQELQRKLANLAKRNNDLKRNVNLHVMEMIGLAEKREGELKYRLQTVLKDKSKIEGTIKKLDEIKEEALRRTWIQVNQDFGQIFSDLLPGNTAKLELVDGKILLGLEVRVRLGQVWKTSLTELSGGQRSLIALALILSFLQFKPAPMYILDEVDAALDLSHTQNIGQLIKTRFTGSQFIIVSLKEGMFTNAHVIFRTKYREGTSTVDRIRNRAVPN